VWDPLVRILHWSLAATFLGAYLLGDHGGPAHEALGYAAAAIVAVRILWGFVGTRYARFAEFVPSKARLIEYLRGLAMGREKRYLGHNPAGGVMILALLAGVIASAGTGWLIVSGAGGGWLAEAHEACATFTLALVGVHVAGVVFSSVRHGENLLRAMVTGRKRA
jgi:cytochrome b